jgi:hypothetical protein
MILVSVLLFIGIFYLNRQQKQARRKPSEDVLVELILRKVLKEDDTAAVALFCAYRVLTMPDGRGLAAVMAAEVDRRYGTRVPWPEELRFHAKVLLDEFYADELSRIEVAIQDLKSGRRKQNASTQIQAELATKQSGW